MVCMRAKKGEQDSAFGDAADFVHLHPVAELVQDRPVPRLDDASGPPLDSRGMLTHLSSSFPGSQQRCFV